MEVAKVCSPQALENSAVVGTIPLSKLSGTEEAFLKQINAGAANLPSEGSRLVITSSADLSRLAPTVALKDLVRAASGELSLDARVGLIAMKEILRRLEFIVREEEYLVDVVVPSAEAVALCTDLGLDTEYAKAIDALVEIGNIEYRDFKGIGSVDLSVTVPTSVRVLQPRGDDRSDKGQIVRRGSVSPTEFEELLTRNKMSGVHEDEFGTYVWVDLPRGGSLTLKLDETKKDILKRLGLLDEFTARLHAYRQRSLADRERRRTRFVQKEETTPTSLRLPSFRFSPGLFPRGMPGSLLPLGADSMSNLDKALQKLRDKIPTGSTIRVSDDKPPRIFLRVPTDKEGEFEDVVFDVESLANAIPNFGKEWVQHRPPSHEIPKLKLNNRIDREVVVPEPDKEPQEESPHWWSSVGNAVKKGVANTVEFVGHTLDGLLGSSGPGTPAKPGPTVSLIEGTKSLDKKTESIKRRLEQVAEDLSRLQQPFTPNISQMLFDLGIDEDERLKISRDGQLAGIGNDLLEVGKAIFGDGRHESQIQDTELRHQLSNYWVELQEALAKVAANLGHHPESFVTKLVTEKTPLMTGKDPAETIRKRSDLTRMAKPKQSPGFVQNPLWQEGNPRFRPGFGMIGTVAVDITKLERQAKEAQRRFAHAQETAQRQLTRISNPSAPPPASGHGPVPPEGLGAAARTVGKFVLRNAQRF